MEDTGEGVETEIEVAGQLRLAPLSVAIAAIDNGACLSVVEAEAPPFKIVHVNMLFIVLYQFRDLVAHL